MTKVSYGFGKTVEVTVSGHAGAVNKMGVDLCCAAASMLSFTLMQTISDMRLPGKKICYADGYAHIEFKNAVSCRNAIAAVNTVLTGFRLLKNEYPDNVRITKM